MPPKKPNKPITPAEATQRLRTAVNDLRAGVESRTLALNIERSTESLVNCKEGDAQRRVKAQAEHVEEFKEAVVRFLDFHPSSAVLAQMLAHLVSDHAAPVGRGTVARTKRITIEQCAEAAVIAWMRHQTTVYDSMQSPRVKGKGQEFQRRLAQELLAPYRLGKNS